MIQSSDIGGRRWYAKKLLRNGFALAAMTTGRGAFAARRTRAPRVHVLTYHRFGRSVRDPFCMAPEEFERQMAWLASHRLAVSLADVERFASGGDRLPDGAVLVTIDDGNACLHAHALPILRRHAIPAVAFVCPGRIDDGSGVDGDAPLTWEQLAEVADAGVVVGSHAWSHRPLGRMDAAEARDEIVRSREVLEERLGRPVTTFAYPFGRRCDYNGATIAACRDAGYRTAFTSEHGAVGPESDPFVLPRVKVEAGDGRWVFPFLARGALDGWRWIDRTLWRLQVAR